MYQRFAVSIALTMYEACLRCASIPIFLTSSLFCYTCHVGFQTKLDYAEHVNNEHGLQILDMEDGTDLSRPTVSSISGVVNNYEFQQGEKDLDIMEYMFRKRDEISRIIQKHTHTNFPKTFD